MYKKREAGASLVLHADLFLEEVPCAESEGIHTAIFAGIECAIATRNRCAIVCVLRLDVVPLNAEPHGRVDIIGQVDDVLRFTCDNVVVDICSSRICRILEALAVVVIHLAIPAGYKELVSEEVRHLSPATEDPRIRIVRS